MVCQIQLLQQEIHCYDPIFYLLEEKTATPMRKEQLSALRCLIPSMLRAAGWYDASPYQGVWGAKNCFKFKLGFALGDDQFIQYDNVSGGVYSCMQMERLISGSPNSVSWASANLNWYRKKIACSILDRCHLD